jgi:hypothetical protein
VALKRALNSPIRAVASGVHTRVPTSEKMVALKQHRTACGVIPNEK